jgi:hypothetical protein
MMEMMKYYKGFIKLVCFTLSFQKQCAWNHFLKVGTLVEGMRRILYVCRNSEQELCCCHGDSSFMTKWSLYYVCCSTQAYGNQGNSLPTCYNFISWDLKRFYVVGSGWFHNFARGLFCWVGNLWRRKIFLDSAKKEI